jgi:2-polyprenyl-3-methyl-5-hydroxy-6-metoxy-1,4-benzoquinol methylase
MAKAKKINPDDLTGWHVVEIDGKKTKGVHDYSGAVGERYLFPDVKGKTVYDIGTFDGYWSARAMKGGAASVVAVDCNERETAKIVADHYGFTYNTSKVFDYNYHAGTAATYDVVLFYGVLYHLWNPINGLMRAMGATNEGGLLCLETAVEQIEGGTRFNAGIHDGDDTNYFMPTEQGVYDCIALAAKLTNRSYTIEATRKESFRLTVNIRLSNG